MKMNIPTPNVEMSAGLEETIFSIGDAGIIFDVLRSKMYSNPILAIAREISSNARDAHREIGTPDRPIQIHLPNAMEPYFKIKDWGPGIGPDRIKEIYTKYGSSTKREDNIQTGFFGLGSKSAWAHTDSFAILTNVDGIQYNYACFIDETKVGKLALTSQNPTQESNGTEIIIPVQPKNFNEFATWTEQACRHWEIKPLIKGGEIRWTKHEPILTGKDWAITHCHDWNRMAMMVIDGIEYPLPIDILRKFADAKLVDCSQGHFIMYFGIGELTLSASRENIFLDEKTQNIIRNRLQSISDEIKKRAVEKISAFDNLWDANVYYKQELKKGFSDIKFLGKLHWNGIELKDGHANTECITYHFTKGAWTRRNHDPNKIKRSTTQHIAFIEKSAIFINDLPLKDPTPRHVRKAFDDDPKLETVQVVVPNDKVSIKDLENKIHIDKMNVRLLSSITKASARKYTPTSARLLVFKFIPSLYNFKQTSYSAMNEDSGNKVLCLLTKEGYRNNRQIVLASKNYLDLSLLQYLAEKYPNNSFYGIDSTTSTDKLEESFSDLESLDDFIENTIIDNGKDNFVEVKVLADKRNNIDYKILRCLDDIKSLINDSNDLFFRRMWIHKKVQDLSNSDLQLLSIYEASNEKINQSDIDKFILDNPAYDKEKLDEEFSARYPLIQHINYYYLNELSQPLANYINLIDQS